MSAKLKNLLQWFDTVGIRLEGCIEIREDPDDGALSVFSTTDLQEGQPLALIPKSAILSVLTCSLSDIIEREQLGGGLALTLALMYERALGAESRWAPYIASLPEGGERLPMFWSESERALLQGTEAEGRGERDAELTVADYEENVAPLFGKYPKVFRKDLLPLLTARDFQVAASWVSSRDFGVDDEHRDSMVPVADIFNHKASVVRLADDFEIANQDDEGEDEEGETSEEEGEEEGGSEAEDEEDAPEAIPLGGSLTDLFRRVSPPDVEPKWRLQIGIVDADDEEGALRIIAASAVPQGQEVYNTYGEHGNATLVCKYGFALEENPFNAVTVSREELEAAAEAAHGKAKAKKRLQFLSNHTHCLDEDEEGDPIEDLELLEGGRLGGALQVALCVLAARDADFRRWRDVDGPVARLRGEYWGPSEEEALNLGRAGCGAHKAGKDEDEDEDDEEEEDEGIALDPQEASVVLRRVGQAEGAAVLRAIVQERLKRYEGLEATAGSIDLASVAKRKMLDLASAEARVEAAKKKGGRAAVASAVLRLSELRILDAVLRGCEVVDEATETEDKVGRKRKAEGIDGPEKKAT